MGYTDKALDCTDKVSYCADRLPVDRLHGVLIASLLY